MTDYEKMIKMANEITKFKLNAIFNNISVNECPYALFPLENEKKEDACSKGLPCNMCKLEWRHWKRIETQERVLKEYGLK